MKNDLMKNDLLLVIAAACIATVGCSAVVARSDRHETGVHSSGETSLMRAAQYGDIERVQSLLKDGADSGIRNGYELDAIIYAAMNGHDEIVELLHRSGANRDKIDLAYLIKWDAPQGMIVRLIDLGCNPDYRGYTQCSPLYLAYERKNDMWVQKLRAAGASLAARNQHGSTLLHLSIQIHNKELLEEMLEQSGMVHAVNEHGETPLHIAARQKNQIVMEQLLNKGADIDAVDQNNASALFIAVLNEDVEATKWLLAKGANKNIQSAWGTPLDFAIQKNRKDLAALLQRHGLPADETGVKL